MDRKIQLSLQDFEGKKVSLIYEGSDLPKGEITPKELDGTLKRVGKNTCSFETDKDEEITLTTNEIQIDSIKIINFVETE